MMNTGINRRRRKKIHYVPGIISAMVLPFALYILAQEPLYNLSLTAITVNWMDSSELNKRFQHLAPNFCKDYFPQRNYLNITFKGNEYEDNIKLAFAQIRMKEIIGTNDTVNALHFVFTDSSHYGTLVQLLDKLRIENAKIYIPDRNNLWFYQLPPDTIPAYSGPYFTCGYHETAVEISWWAETKEKLSRIWLSSWQLIVLFCCFVAAVLFLKWRKRHG